MFLSSINNVCTTFLKVVMDVMVLQSATCPIPHGRGKQGHTLYEMFLLQQIVSFSSQCCGESNTVTTLS